MLTGAFIRCCYCLLLLITNLALASLFPDTDNDVSVTDTDDISVTDTDDVSVTDTDDVIVKATANRPTTTAGMDIKHI